MGFSMEQIHQFAENSSLGTMCMVLAIMMGLDVLSGVIAAAINSEASSTRMLKGLLQKLLVFVVLFVAVLMQYVFPPIWSGTAMALWFIGREAMSIVEKCGKAGVPIPQWVVDRLSQLNGSETKGEKSLVTANINVQNVAATMPPGTIMPVVVSATPSDSSILRDLPHT